MINKCYIITYKKPSDLDGLKASIRSYGTWARILENTWAIVTSDSAKDIRNKLTKHFSSEGRLFIIKSGVESAWQNVECTNEWLQKNI